MAETDKKTRTTSAANRAAAKATAEPKAPAEEATADDGFEDALEGYENDPIIVPPHHVVCDVMPGCCVAGLNVEGNKARVSGPWPDDDEDGDDFDVDDGIDFSDEHAVILPIKAAGVLQKRNQVTVRRNTVNTTDKPKEV